MNTILQFFKQFPLRRLVQALFVSSILIIGLQFFLFVLSIEGKINPEISRPAGVEGFLPISSIMGLKHAFLNGSINQIHPSGVMILLAVLFTAIFLKRAFCSWVCPIGMLNEFLSFLHTKIFKRPLKIPRFMDSFLRSIKYLLLLFFVWAIFILMDKNSIETFLYSPYNRIADIKMLKFFTNISQLTLIVISILTILSVLIRNFWCRYLCPYGALLGFFSLFSFVKIRRVTDKCTDCGKCTKVCPTDIKVHQIKTIHSDECHACLNCTTVCPEKGALEFTSKYPKFKLNILKLAIIIPLLFVLISIIGRITGNWHSSIDRDEYKYHIRKLESPLYMHNRGSVPNYTRENLEKRIEMWKEMQKIKKQF